MAKYPVRAQFHGLNVLVRRHGTLCGQARAVVETGGESAPEDRGYQGSMGGQRRIYASGEGGTLKAADAGVQT